SRKYSTEPLSPCAGVGDGKQGVLNTIPTRISMRQVEDRAIGLGTPDQRATRLHASALITNDSANREITPPNRRCPDPARLTEAEHDAGTGQHAYQQEHAQQRPQQPHTAAPPQGGHSAPPYEDGREKTNASLV